MGIRTRGNHLRGAVYLRSSSLALRCALISCAVISCSGGESLEHDSNIGQLEQALEGPIRAVRDGVYNVDQGQTLVVAAAQGLLANDSGAPPLSVSAGAVSRRGNPIDVQPDGSFTFTPVADFFGDDRIDYVLTDGSGAQKSSGARIVVRPINATAKSINAGSAGFEVQTDLIDPRSPELEALGDVNGDGFGDFGIEAYGFFHVVFGKADRNPMDTDDLSLGDGFTIEEEGGAGYAWYGQLTGLGDVNGDGFNDIGVSSRDDLYVGSGCFVVLGKGDSTTVRLQDVANGDGGFVITDSADSDHGCGILGPGDVNGDGLDDVVVERSTVINSDVNGVYVIFGNTASGPVDLVDIEAGVGGYALFHTESMTLFDEQLIQPVAAAGDMNQDGLADFLIDFSSIYDGFDPNVAAVVFGKSDTAPETLEASIQGGGGFFIQDLSPEPFRSHALSSGGDVNGDGIPDLTFRRYATPSSYRSTEVAYVVFGKGDAAPIDLGLVGSGSAGFLVDSAGEDFFGPLIVADLNADGRDDLVFSETRADFVDAPYSGALAVAYGRSETSALAFDDLETGSGGFVVRGALESQGLGLIEGSAGDVDADGFGDLLFSFKVRHREVAQVYSMLLGADFTGSVTSMGSPGVDTLVAREGAAVADVLVGERGDDRLTSDGGPDVLLGGGGADQLTIVDANFSRLDAGTGSDVLKLGSAGMALALDAIPSSRLRSIETIDAVGAAANAIRVDVQRAVPLPVGTNTLTLRADASDTVTVVRGSATVSSSGGFVTYALGQFELRISDVATIVEE